MHRLHKAALKSCPGGQLLDQTPTTSPRNLVQNIKCGYENHHADELVSAGLPQQSEQLQGFWRMSSPQSQMQWSHLVQSSPSVCPARQDLQSCFDTGIAEQRTAISPFVFHLSLAGRIACILWLMLRPYIRHAMIVLQAVASICAIAPADGNRRGNKEWEGGSVPIIVATAQGILYEYAVHNLQGPQAPTCALEQECYLLRNPM